MFSECRIDIAINGKSPTIHVAGHPTPWDFPHNVLILVLKTGSCSVREKMGFNLTSPANITAFIDYLTNLPSGTIVVGRIGPVPMSQANKIKETLNQM